MSPRPTFLSNVLGLLILLLVGSPVAAVEGVAFHRVVSTGDPLPDGAPGETIAEIWDHPALVSDRCVAFGAKGSAGSEGIYLRRDGAVERIMDLTTPVPGAELDVGFTQIEGFALSGCTVMYSAEVSSSYHGIYVQPEVGPAEVLVDPTIPVPNEPGYTFEDAWRPWFDGQFVAFVGHVEACLGAPAETIGIYVAGPGGITPVVDTCRSAVPGGQPGERFLFEEGTIPILEGQTMTFRARGDLGTEGIYAIVGGPLHAVADTYTEVPGGLPGELFDTDGFLDLTVVSNSQVSLAARGDMGTLGLFVETAGVLELFYDLSVPPPTWLPGEALDLTMERPIGPWLHQGVITFFAAGDMGSRGVYRTNGVTTTALMYRGHGFDGGVLQDLMPVPHATAERVVFIAEVSEPEDLISHWGVYVASLPLFADGFESGNTSAW